MYLNACINSKPMLDKRFSMLEFTSVALLNRGHFSFLRNSLRRLDEENLSVFIPELEKSTHYAAFIHLFHFYVGLMLRD